MESPEFFKHGISPLARVGIVAVLSIALMITDARFSYLERAREAASVALYPLEQLASSPFSAYRQLGAFFVGHALLERQNLALKRRLLRDSAQLQRYAALEAENAYLRRLLGVRARQQPTPVLADIIHNARDPFIQKLIVDKGAYAHIRAGSAVIDANGVIGQVTRVFPLTAEVTLLTSKDEAVPVEVVRNGLRAITMGAGRPGELNLPYMPVNADIRAGDVLVTSGIDGTYPAGLPVAVVGRVERDPTYPFAKITCISNAGADEHTEVLILRTPPTPAPVHPAAPAGDDN
ncbi:MAG: rod shape-determining protein MreC [Betaproteobacteria bacterium]|nr:rod shape-determining protein MreC [Betaproteobacteria bacterium]